MSKLHILENGAIKAIDFTPWGGLDGFLSATSNGGNGDAVALRKVVPWLNKAVNMTGNAVAQLPYYFDDGAENEIDKDIAWGAVRNPQTLLYLIASSLCGGSAYALMETTNRAIISIQYLEPSTVTPNFNTSTGELINFTRSYNAIRQTIPIENMLYFWLPDDTIEVGAAQIHPLRNAMLPAGLIGAMDYTLQQYGERGFIPHTILSAKGLPNKTEAEKLEKWWNLWLRMKDKTAAKIVNADVVSTSVVGAGMDELRGSYIEIVRQQIENIASAFNIPLSLFLSNAANYATSMADRKTWYETGVFVSIYQTIEDTLSEQLFNRFGYDFEFDPDGIDAFQEDENAKAGSLSTLANAFATNPEASIIAASVLGYELSEEDIAAIEALGVKEEAEPPVELATDTEQDQTPRMDLPTDEENLIADEMMKWRTFAEKPRKRQFETKHIPPALALRISAGLRELNADSISYFNGVQKVFDAAVAELPIIRLAKAIENEQ